MAERIEDLSILFMKRNARARGPTSSAQQNDSREEIAHDLAAIARQWNDQLVPLTAALPDGTEGNANVTVDAFENGLDGKNLFVVQGATSTSDAAYYNSAAARAKTVYEQFQDVYTTISEEVGALANQIGFNTLNASQVVVADTGNNYASSNVEDALTEIAATLASLTTGSTSFARDLLPTLDNTYNIGSSALKWKDLYIHGSFQLGETLGSASNPSLALGDGDTGIYESSDDVMEFATAGAQRATLDANGISMASSGGASIRNETASSTNPTLCPNKSDTDSGIGQNSADQLSIIVGGLELLRAVETGTSTSDQLIIGPAAIIGAAATPALAFGDGDTGFYEDTDDVLHVVCGTGSAAWQFSSVLLGAVTSNRPALRNVNAGATTPSLLPRNNDTDTGIGGNAVDQLSLIAGGLEAIRITESGSQTFTQVNGQIWSEHAAEVTPSGTTQTIDFHDGNSQAIDLESATGDVTLTLDNPQSGASYIIKITQDSTTPLDVIWPASVLWPDGVTPTISTGADAVDVVSLYYDGTNFFATIAQNFS